MRELDPNELRFQIRRGLQQLSASTLRDIAGAADRRERGLNAATGTLAARFAGHQVFAPDPIPAHGDTPGREIPAQTAIGEEG